MIGVLLVGRRRTSGDRPTYDDDDENLIKHLSPPDWAALSARSPNVHESEPIGQHIGHLFSLALVYLAPMHVPVALNSVSRLV